MAEAAREQIIIDVSTKGLEEADRKVGKLTSDLDSLTAAQGRSAASADKGTAAQDRASAARARMEERVARFNRQIEAEARLMAMAQASTDAASGSLSAMAARQMEAMRATEQATRAVNDNAAAAGRQGEAYRTAGAFVAAHPLLVLAASAAAAKGLSSLSTSAAGYLGTASVATARYGAASVEMGGAVAAGAAVASRGLAGMSSGATAAATGLGKYAETVTGLSTATGLMSTALRLVPGLLGPIGVAFLAFEAGSAAINKAYRDLAKLVDLGERARTLDIAAPFLKSFESLAPAIRASSEEMAAAIKQASSFVADRASQRNSLTASISGLYDQGFFGANKPASMDAAEVATTTRPHAANNFVKAMRGLYGWAMGSEEMAKRVGRDPTTGVKLLAGKNDDSGFHAWTEEEVTRFEAKWLLGTRQRLAFDLLLYTGLRRGDAVRLGRPHVRHDEFTIRTEKTGMPVTAPILPALAASIATAPTGELTFIVTERGTPFTKESFGTWFGKVCREAKCPGSAHGLRKAGARRAAEDGATEAQLNALFGWADGSRESAVYTRTANREKMAREARRNRGPGTLVRNLERKAD